MQSEYKRKNTREHRTSTIPNRMNGKENKGVKEGKREREIEYPTHSHCPYLS